MYDLYRTRTFIDWIDGLRDKRAAAHIARRLLMLQLHGHFGDRKQVARSVIEMRVHFGPCYRVYLTQRGSKIVVLLCGGDKGSQGRDIENAIELAKTTEVDQ
jgi:putative addiction module killer protein